MVAPSIKFKDQEFNATLKKYLTYSKRDLATAINTKAYYIARRATVETPKADKTIIRRTTGEVLGKIVNKRRGLRGEKGLYGKEMAKAVKSIMAARLKSVAFLKSGWLPSIRILEKHAERRGIPKMDRTAKQHGKNKGSAVPSRLGWKIAAQIINAASALKDKKYALELYGGPALRRAFAFETQSMRDYIARKLKKSAQSLGIRTR